MGNSGCVVLKDRRAGGRRIQKPRMPMNSLHVEVSTNSEHCSCFGGNSNHLAPFPSLQRFPQDGSQQTQLQSKPSLSLTQSFWMHTICRSVCPQGNPRFIRYPPIERTKRDAFMSFVSRRSIREAVSPGSARCVCGVGVIHRTQPG